MIYSRLRIQIVIHVISLALLVVLLSSCGSSDVTQSLSAEDRFVLGKKKFDEGDCLEAINDLEIVKLQFPGSGVADDAQFLIAECRYKLGEYLLAAQEYQGLKRNFPASPLVPMTQYQTAMCYYLLSPKSSLDQTNTTRAIDEFQTFIDFNPTHELAPGAAEKIKELNTRLAKKLYDTATLYMTLEYYRAATIYFGTVVEKYHDTKYAEPAYLGKVKALIARGKYEEAKEGIDKYFEKYPNGELKGQAEPLRREIDDHLKIKSATDTRSRPKDLASLNQCHSDQF